MSAIPDNLLIEELLERAKSDQVLSMQIALAAQAVRITMLEALIQSKEQDEVGQKLEVVNDVVETEG
jgi:hypothetical protein